MNTNTHYTIDCISSWDALIELKESWDLLATQNNEHTIFQDFIWHQAWWHAFGSDYELRVYVAKHHDVIVAIAPLVYNKTNHSLEFLGSPEIEYNNFLYHPDHTAAIDVLLLNIFSKHTLQAITLWDIPKVFLLYKKINHLLKKKNIPCTYSTYASFQTYTLGSTPHNKRDVRQRHNKLKRHGTLTFTTNTANDAQHLDVFFEYLSGRFKRSMSPHRHRQLTPQFKRFFKELITQFEGQAYLYALSLNAVPVSLNMILTDGSHSYFILPSHHPNLNFYSPGSVLIQEAINQAIQKEHTSFDFLRGDESYKMRFVNTSIELGRFNVHPSKAHYYKAEAIRTVKSILKPFVFKVFSYIERIRSTDFALLSKKIVFGTLYYSGLAHVYQRLTKQRKRILNYHSISTHPLTNTILSVSPKTFESQMKTTRSLIEQGYDILVTFDDGYKDALEHACPVLDTYTIPSIVYPTISFIENGCVPGWDNEPDFPALTWEDVRTLNEREHISIGSHTCTHPSLRDQTSEVIANEFTKSKEILEKQLHPTIITSIAYPFGKERNIDNRTFSIAQDCGFSSGYTLFEGTNPVHDFNPLAQKRIVVFEEPHYMFKTRVSGIWDDICVPILEGLTKALRIGKK